MKNLGCFHFHFTCYSRLCVNMQLTADRNVHLLAMNANRPAARGWYLCRDRAPDVIGIRT